MDSSFNSNKKNDKSAGYCEWPDIHAEDAEKLLAENKKSQENQEWYQGGFPGMNTACFGFDIKDDGYWSGNVNNRKQHHETGQYVNETEVHFKFLQRYYIERQ